MGSSWQFQPIMDSYALVAFLVAVLLGLLWVRPAFANTSLGQNRALIVLRFVLILLLAIAMLRPTRIDSKEQIEASQLILLADRSRSMGVADGADGTTRWEAMKETIQGIAPLAGRMTDRIVLRLYLFDKTAESASDQEGLALPDEPTGKETDIGAALDKVLRRELGKQLAGIVLLSDGTQRALQPRADARQTARELSRLGTPLYTIAYGLPRDLQQARDIAIKNLRDQYHVFIKNELVIRATLHVSGYVNQEIPVTLEIQSPDGKMRELGPQFYTAVEDGESISVEFTFTPEDAGQYKATLIATPQRGETVADNNQMSTFITALDGGLQVLYLYGNAEWQEHKFAIRALAASPDCEVDYEWIDPRTRDRWPIDWERLTKGKTYDVVILSDVDAMALGPDGCQAIATLVDEGHGLLMAGGFHSFGPGGYSTTALADVLPVRMSGLERQDFEAPVRLDVHWSQELPLVPTRDHFITHLANGEKNAQLWKQLPPLQGANRLEKKDNGLVLLSSLRDVPLLVAGQYGGGRVLALAGDSTFRWHRYGLDAPHQRFWRQMILWLSRKDDLVKDDVWLRLEQRRFLPGARFELTAGARDGNGDPMMGVQMQAELTGGEQVVHVPLSAIEDDWVASLEAPLQPGEYQIRVTAVKEGQTVGTAEESFLVLNRDLELADPVANPQHLRMLAELTQSAGGRIVAPEQLKELLEELESQPPQHQVRRITKWRLGDTSYGAWLFFLGVVSLLTVEWFLRKKWGLV